MMNWLNRRIAKRAALYMARELGEAMEKRRAVRRVLGDAATASGDLHLHKMLESAHGVLDIYERTLSRDNNTSPKRR